MVDGASVAEIRAWLERLAAGDLDLRADNCAFAHGALGLLPAPASPDLPDGYLAPHFTLAELTRSDTATAHGLDNTPPPAALGELALLALTLEKVRALLGGHPVHISSGYRSPKLNALVGGASQSAHMAGAAADFTVPDFGTVLECCHALAPHLRELAVDQLIFENAAWIHLGRAPGGAAPRYQCLTISGGSTVEGFP